MPLAAVAVGAPGPVTLSREGGLLGQLPGRILLVAEKTAFRESRSGTRVSHGSQYDVLSLGIMHRAVSSTQYVFPS